MAKKTNFGPDFGLFGPNLGPQKIFVGFTSTRYFIIPGYHPMQFAAELMN